MANLMASPSCEPPWIVSTPKPTKKSYRPDVDVEPCWAPHSTAVHAQQNHRQGNLHVRFVNGRKRKRKLQRNLCMSVKCKVFRETSYLIFKMLFLDSGESIWDATLRHNLQGCCCNALSWNRNQFAIKIPMKFSSRTFSCQLTQGHCQLEIVASEGTKDLYPIQSWLVTYSIHSSLYTNLCDCSR